MSKLVAFLIGFYMIFNRQWLWNKFTTARNESRILFGLVVFEGALLIWLYVVVK